MKLSKTDLAWEQMLRERNIKMNKLKCGSGKRYNGSTVRDEVQTNNYRS